MGLPLVLMFCDFGLSCGDIRVSVITTQGGLGCAHAAQRSGPACALKVDQWGF
jgi:hypothetical protein